MHPVKLQTLKPKLKHILNISVVHNGTVIFYLSIFYQMYLWFLCIFIFYTNLLRNKDSESDPSDSVLPCTRPH